MTASAYRARLDGFYVEQTADDILDYAADWSGFFPPTDPIVSSVWAATDVTVSMPEQSGFVTSAFVHGPAGVTGRVSNTVTTAAGRRKRFDFDVIVSP